LERTRELETANRQLELVNRELESFSYSVSHDLRAPLRTVQGFCQIFMEDYGAAVPPEGLKTLEHVISGSRRMGQLIDDILALSQLGRKPLRRRSMCLSELTQRVVAELRARDSGRAVEVRIGDLGYCDGDVSLIEQVLVNLLSNAFKFTARSASAVIEVDCTPSEEGPVYCVRDNGAGFDMKYVDKLFGLFQRLHPASEFEGTGVGLSIVRRIIQRHGGRIWAQSEPGKGAIFYFTIPAAAAAA
jgi:light-regulated signal transduction histidine kinase (bacteriophytochrome)